MIWSQMRTLAFLSCLVWIAVLCGLPAFGSMLFEAPLTSGDYGDGVAIDTMDPDHGGSPHVLGIVDSVDGVTFTPTETGGRSNALINWEIPSANRTSFRTSGTVSMWIKGDRDAHAAMASWGALWGENYGFTAFHNGQSTFSGASSHVANDPGPEDDQMRLSWQAWHSSTWYQLGSVDLDYGRWYHVGFAWGGANHSYELWVDGELASYYDLPSPASLPWGLSNSGVNWGLGDNHERGYDAYGSNVGITYADIRIWDEYRGAGDTTAPAEADLWGGPAIGIAPLDVSFMDVSAGLPTSWEWDFGDGSTSTAQDPSHQYTEVGTYEVGLTVGELRGEDSVTRPHYVIVTFPDVPFEREPHWAMYHILACVDAEVVAGYEDDLYHPEIAVTRDQMAVYIARALAGGEAKVPSGPAEATFNDVATDYWSFDHVEYCVANNVVQGYDAVTYAPKVEVTRDQMAVYVARALVVPSGDAALLGYVPADPRNFPDVLSDTWAYKHIEYCVENAVVQGYDDGSYHPEYVVTRDQMAVYVARAFELDMAAPTYDITDCFPLGEGDTWTCGEGDDAFTRVVSGTVEIFGRTCVRIMDTEGSSEDAWISEPEGLYYAGTSDSGDALTFDPPVRFPNHIAVGDSGLSNTVAYLNDAPVGTGTMSWELLAVEEVTVPAGTFEDCLKMRITPSFPGDVADIHIWFAPGVGMVKYDSLTAPEAWELESANIGGVAYP